jgi:pyridoxamine 5'-phosphate oxidase
MRRDYRRGALAEEQMAATWLAQFDRWFADAVAAVAFPEPNAMVVATAARDGRPSVRTVLLKAYDERGLVFFTNYRSRKGRELTDNPQVAAQFGWYALERQVIVEGWAQKLTPEESTEYFHSRPRGSQLAAAVSPQSQVIPDRQAIEGPWADLSARYPVGATVPRPEHWGGVRIAPSAVEFWQGRENRLHDRLRYRRTPSGAWAIERLAP